MHGMLVLCIPADKPYRDGSLHRHGSPFVQNIVGYVTGVLLAVTSMQSLFFFLFVCISLISMCKSHCPWVWNCGTIVTLAVGYSLIFDFQLA